MLFWPRKEITRFGIGDLVYDEYYGRGVIVDFDARFDEMEVSFQEGRQWLTTPSVNGITLVSRAKDRAKVLDKSLTE